MSLRLSFVAACVVGGGAVKLDAAADARAGTASAASIQGSRMQMLTSLRTEGGFMSGEPFNEAQCAKYPEYCKAPFNCHIHTPRVQDAIISTLAVDGHPNFNLWCSQAVVASYYKYMKECIADKDLKKAGQTQFQWSAAQAKMGIGIDDLDASYCFIEGHCSNEAVTENTTVAEAEAMCDRRYGHEGWTSQFNIVAQMAPQLPATALSIMAHGGTQNGFHDQSITQVFLKAACAMGNYHCDVMYCKETYCKNEHYANKYRHLMPAKAGHLLTQVGPFAKLI